MASVAAVACQVQYIFCRLGCDAERLHIVQGLGFGPELWGQQQSCTLTGVWVLGWPACMSCGVCWPLQFNVLTT